MRVGIATALLALCLLLTACGNGTGSGDQRQASTLEGLRSTPADCSLATQSAWLIQWMKDWYFWYREIPSALNSMDPQMSLDQAMRLNFSQLLFKGSGDLPPDRWSYVESTDRYQQYYEEGVNLGFGISVAGQPEDPLPLRVRWVEPRSNAAELGIRRGDIVVSMRGRSAELWKQANDFSPLVAQSDGDRLAIEIQSPGGLRQLEVQASRYPVTSVIGPITEFGANAAGGRPTSYIFLKDFIDKATAPLGLALEDVGRRGTRDLILDLRYHGGGRVALATQLASAIAPKAVRNEVFSQLVYNDKHSNANTFERFVDPLPLPELEIERLVILTGARTCSASEMLIHGLKARHPSLQVISIGTKTCGKPYGFHPQTACGLSYQAVNFVVRNARGEQSDVSGMPPDCIVADDYQSPLGSELDPLVSSARYWLGFGKCPPRQLSILDIGSRNSAKSAPVKDGDQPQFMVK